MMKLGAKTLQTSSDLQNVGLAYDILLQSL